MTKWKYEITIFSYEILWRASQTALDMAEIEDERIRPDHLSISSILTGFLAFEGFLNFVGEEIASEAWENEKKFFSCCGEFQGVIGKVEYLFSKFQEKELKKGEEPYQTFKRIKDIRDFLAHNRITNYEEVSESNNPSFDPHWKDFNTPEKVKPDLEKLKQFAEIIRIEAEKLLVDDYKFSHLHFPAFGGRIGTSEGHSIN